MAAQGLIAPPAVSAATSDYRTEMDTLGVFLGDRCKLEPNADATAGELYSSYRSWAESNGEKPLSQRWFGQKLVERGFTSIRKHGGHRYWKGCG